MFPQSPMYLMKRYESKKLNKKAVPDTSRNKKDSLTSVKANKEVLAENKTLKKELALLQNKIKEHRDNLSYPLIFTDQKFNIIYFNKSAKKLGTEVKVGNNLFKIFPELSIHKKELKTDSVTIKIKSNYYRFIQSFNDSLYNFYLYDETKSYLESARIAELEKSYSSLVSNIPGVVFRCHYHKDWTMKFMSPSCLDLTGYLASDFIDSKKRTFGSIIHKDNSNFNVDSINDAIKLGTSYEVEYKIVTKNKITKWVLERGMPIFDDNNELLYLEGILSDVTDRKEKQIEIEINYQNYFNLLNRVNTGVFIFNKKLELQYINQTGLEIKGFKDIDDARGRNLLEYIDKKDLAVAKERIGLALAGNITPGKRYTARRKNMESYEAYVISSPIVFNNETCIQISITDLTPLIEKEIFSRESQYIELLNRINTGVVIYDEDFKMQYANQTLLKLLNFSSLEEYGKRKIFDNFHIESRDIAIKRFLAIAKNDAISSGYRYSVLTKDHVKIEMFCVGSIVKYNNKKCVQISVTDLTEINRFQDIIKQQRDNYLQMLNGINSGVLILNKNKEVIFINDRGKKITGYKDEKDFTNAIFSPHVPLDYYNEAIDRVFNSNLPFSYQTKSYDKNAKEFFVDVYIEQINFDNQDCVLASFTDITESRKQQEQIKNQRDNYLQMLNKMNLSVVIVNKHRDVIFINETTKAVSGFNSEAEFNEVLRHPHLPATYFNEAIERVFNSSKPISYQTLSYKKNLEPYFIDVNVAQIEFDGQDCILVSFADITVSKQQEEIIKTQRDDYFNIIDDLPLGVIILDENFKYLFANDSAMKISGFDDKDVFLNSSLLDYILPEQLPDALMALEQAKKGPIGPVYFNVLKYDKSIFEAEAFASIFTYDGKKCIQITYSDVSVLKKAKEEKERAKALQLANNKLQKEINDRLIAENQLKNTRNYLRLLIESSRDMIVACDKDGYITEFNIAAQKVFGYDLNEIIGKHFSELYSTKSEYKRIYNALDFNTSGFSGEIKNKRKNGTEFFASLSATILRNERNEIIGSMGVSRDITRLKEDEILLKDSEERYKAVFNQAFIGIARVDVNTGEFIEVNQHLCNMLGYKKSELLKLTNNQLTLETDQNINLKVKIIEHKKASFSVQKRYIHRDGHIVYINLSYSLVVDDLKRPLYFILVYDDLTDRIKYESEILKQSSRLSAIFNSTSHLIWTLNLEGKLLSYNSNYANFFFEIYGVHPTKGISPVNLRELVKDDNFLKQWDKYFKISLKGHPTNFIAKNPDKHGNVIFRDIYINPVFDEKSNIIELSVIAHNITDKVKIQERLRKNISEKETLLKEIHHRVKNNLQIISSMLSLQSRNILDEGTKRVLLDSQNRVKSMSIIHELLYNTKDFENIDFSKYVTSIISNLQQSHHEPGKEVNIHCELDTLPLDLDNAIPSGLILNELISNAYKHAFFTLEKGNIFVKVKRNGNAITFSVADDGVGLTNDYNMNNSLGLGLVYSLVGQLNGTIVINHVNGSEFIINYQI